MPKVSIILTSYNHEKYIAQAIESVLLQSFSDYELHLVDDGSGDNSMDVINSFQDPRITVHSWVQNRRGDVYRPTLPLCKGEYIAVHHSDDSWSPDKLQKQVEFLDSNPDTVACFTHVQLIDENGDEYTPHESDFYYKKFDQPNRNRFEWLRFFWDHGNALCHPSVLIRKDAYEKFHMLSTRGMAQMPDFLMWIRVCLNGEIHVIQEKLTFFRLHNVSAANASGDKPDNHIRSATEFFLLCKDLFRISERDKFFNVFPDYQGQDIVPEFVMARLMVESGNKPSQLFGLTKIYELLNNLETSAQLQEKHNYTNADFISDTGKYDVFSFIGKLTFLNASLYLDYGDGYSEKDSIKELVYLRATGSFLLKITCAVQQDVVSLRYDPDETSLWDIAIDSVKIDGNEQRITAINASRKIDDFDSFFTTDPIYEIAAPKRFSEVEIRGRVRPLSVQFVELIAGENKSLKAENERASGENERISAESVRLSNENARLSADVSEFRDENARLSTEVSEFRDENAQLHNANTKMTSLIENLNSEKASFQNELNTIKRSRLLRVVAKFTKCRSLFEV